MNPPIKPVRVRIAKNLYCTFQVDPDADGVVTVEWDPRKPVPMPRKLMRRYIEARDRAYGAIAAQRGDKLLVADMVGGDLPSVVSVFHPGGRVERVGLNGESVH